MTVRITNIVEGTTIEGHDAVKAHVMLTRPIIFQVYRLNLPQRSRNCRSRRLRWTAAPITDTVAAVKGKVRLC